MVLDSLAKYAGPNLPARVRGLLEDLEHAGFTLVPSAAGAKRQFKFNGKKHMLPISTNLCFAIAGFWVTGSWRRHMDPAMLVLHRLAKRSFVASTIALQRT
jgi:hypothetical protein